MSERLFQDTEDKVHSFSFREPFSYILVTSMVEERGVYIQILKNRNAPFKT